MTVHPGTRAARRAAFTLMEVLVVVAILVILISVVSIGVFGYLEGAKKDAAKMGATAIGEAAAKYKIRWQNFPESLEELVTPIDGEAAPLEPNQLLDPWLRPYQYDPSQVNGKGIPLVYSEGPNPGDPTSMITNWANNPAGL